MTLWFPVAPMLATPAERVPGGDGWAFEVKWDGYRTIAFVASGAVRLQSRSGLDVTATYGDVAESLAEQTFATTLVLDAELVALGDDGRPSFGALQRGQPASLYVFDVLRVDDHDTVSLGYLERRRLMSEIVAPGGPIDVPSHRVGDGATLVESTLADGLEGVIAKRVDSTYQVGTRSPSWRKVKHRSTMTVTVGGYTVGTGARAATVGSLLVGTPTEHGPGLRFRGAVGTGFDDATLVELKQVLDQLATDECPFDPPPTPTPARGARWVAPLLEMIVSMSELTDDGHIRHGSFVGWHAPEADTKTTRQQNKPDNKTKGTKQET